MRFVVLDRVDTADPLRAEADRLRADIQRDLLAAAGIATPGPGRARCAAVKCPKCHYLGFETGDRCKNCGYDFSLMSEPEISIDPDLDIDLALRASDDTLPATVQWDDNFDHMDADALADAAALAESPATIEIADPDPEHRRPRRSAKRSTRVDRPGELVLAPHRCSTTATSRSSGCPRRLVPRWPCVARRKRRGCGRCRGRCPGRRGRSTRRRRSTFVEDPPPRRRRTDGGARARTATRLAAVGWSLARRIVPCTQRPARPVARLAAAAIDHVLLGAIDLAVVYFTLRMTGLTMADLSMLPAAPLVAFLLLVKLSYFCAFTAVGGQTIGKMAMRIRVVTAEDETVDGALAVKRTLAGVASAATLGLGFLPALVGSDRRALHDRLTHTRASPSFA